MENKTEIEKWIEETSNVYKLRSSASVFQESHKNDFTIGCNQLLTYLGLDMPDPKKWVEDGKDSHRKYLLVRSNNKAKATIIEQLQAENERLKEALARIYTCDVSVCKTEFEMIFKLREIAEQSHPDLNKQALKGE
jgi:hypothetical protein